MSTLSASFETATAPARRRKQGETSTLKNGALILGIIGLLAASIAVPAFANTNKRIVVGQEDIESAVKVQAATFVLVSKLGGMQ